MLRILKVIFRELFRVTWLVAAIHVANKILNCGLDDLGNECQLAGWLLMTALTFPIGIFWAILTTLIGMIADVIGIFPNVSSFWLNLIQVLFFVMLGYLQWFYIVPAMYKKYLKSRNSKIKSMASDARNNSN